MTTLPTLSFFLTGMKLQLAWLVRLLNFCVVRFYFSIRDGRNWNLQWFKFVFSFCVLHDHSCLPQKLQIFKFSMCFTDSVFIPCDHSIVHFFFFWMNQKHNHKYSCACGIPKQFLVNLNTKKISESQPCRNKTDDS